MVFGGAALAICVKFLITEILLIGSAELRFFNAGSSVLSFFSGVCSLPKENCKAFMKQAVSDGVTLREQAFPGVRESESPGFIFSLQSSFGRLQTATGYE